jgi:plastocyanin
VINDSDEVTYYANNEFLGNDPLQYILKFNKSISQRKVVFRPNTLSNVFYNTTDTSINPINVLVSTNEPLIYNMVDIQNNPTYTVTPVYSEDTPIGKFAMVFDDSKQHSLTFDNMNIDANNLTLSTWVNMSEFKLDKNPIISQENIFEFGIDNTGAPYLNILNGENPKDYISSVSSISLSDTSFIIENIVITPDNPTYFYYIATVNKMTKKEVLSLIDQYKQTDVVSMDILTTETVIASKSISYILDANNTIQSVSSVDSGYVYISARNSQEDYSITMLNDFKELSATNSDSLPYINFIEFSQSNNTRIIESATLYNNYVIDKFYVFSFELSTTTSSSLTYNVNASSGSYVFTGDSTGTYPTLSVYTGDTLTFNVSVSGHPFWIKSQANVTGSQYALSGIFNNGAETGSIVWTPDTSGTFYYQCGYHSGMNGEIVVNDHIFKNSLTD